jgi:hypothetical protein
VSRPYWTLELAGFTVEDEMIFPVRTATVRSKKWKRRSNYPWGWQSWRGRLGLRYDVGAVRADNGLGAIGPALMIHSRLPAFVGLALMQAKHLVPDLGRALTTLRLARAMHHDRPLRRFPGPVEVTTLAIPLLAFAIRRATRSAIAMEAKGLRPAQPRSHLPHLPIRVADFVGLFVGLAALLGVWCLI